MSNVARLLVSLPFAAVLLSACYSDPAYEVRYTDTPVGKAAVIGGIVREPQVVARVNPAATNTAGFVKARLVIDENGLVKNVEILSATDNAAAQSAKDALAQWKFTPTFVSGAPVKVVYELKITFK
jgi:TonB family protein